MSGEIPPCIQIPQPTRYMCDVKLINKKQYICCIVGMISLVMIGVMGIIIAMRGQVYRNVNADFLRGKLKYLQNRNQQVTKLTLRKRRFMNGKKDSKSLGE